MMQEQELMKEINELAKLPETITAKVDDTVKKSLEKVDAEVMKVFQDYGYNNTSVTGQDKIVNEVANDRLNKYRRLWATHDDPKTIAMQMIGLLDRVFYQKIRDELGLTLTDVHGESTNCISGKIDMFGMRLHTNAADKLKNLGWDITVDNYGNCYVLNTVCNTDKLMEYIGDFGTMTDFHVSCYDGGNTISDVRFLFVPDKLEKYDLIHMPIFKKPSDSRKDMAKHMGNLLKTQSRVGGIEYLAVFSMYFCNLCKTFEFEGAVTALEARRVTEIKNKGQEIQSLDKQLKESLPDIRTYHQYAETIRKEICNKFVPYGSDFQYISISPLSITVKLFPQNFPKTFEEFSSEKQTIAFIQTVFPEAVRISLKTKKYYKPYTLPTSQPRQEDWMDMDSIEFDLE